MQAGWREGSTAAVGVVCVYRKALLAGDLYVADGSEWKSFFPIYLEVCVCVDAAAPSPIFSLYVCVCLGSVYSQVIFTGPAPHNPQPIIVYIRKACVMRADRCWRISITFVILQRCQFAQKHLLPDDVEFNIFKNPLTAIWIERAFQK